MMPMRIEMSAAPLQNKFMAKTPEGKNFRIGCQSWGYEDWITPTRRRLRLLSARDEKERDAAILFKGF